MANQIDPVRIDFTTNIAKLSKDFTKVDERLKRLEKNADEAGKSTEQFEKKTTKSFKKAGESTNKLNKAVGKIGKTLKGLAIGAGVVVGFQKLNEFVKGSIQTYADFEKASARVNALLDIQGEQAKKLRDQAELLGDTTVYTATQVAEGQQFLAQAGFNTLQVYEALPKTLELATAGQISLAESADIATNVLTGFKLESEDTGRVTDNLVKLQSSFNNSVLEAGNAFKTIAPIASTLGVSLEETAGAIGALANQGLKGAEAVTTIRTAFTRLAKPTRESQKLIDELGLEFFDASGEFVGLTGTVKELEDSFKDLAPEQRLANLATIFGAEAINQISILYDTGSENLEKYTEAQKKATGEGQRFSGVLLDTIAGDLALFNSAVDGVKRSIGEAFAPSVRAGLQNLTNFIGRNKDAIVAGFVEIEAFLKTFSNQILDTFSAIREFSDEIGFTALIFETLRATAGFFLKGLQTIQIVFQKGTSIVQGFGKALNEALPESLVSVINAIGGSIDFVIEKIKDGAEVLDDLSEAQAKADENTNIRQKTALKRFELYKKQERRTQEEVVQASIAGDKARFMAEQAGLAESIKNRKEAEKDIRELFGETSKEFKQFQKLNQIESEKTTASEIALLKKLEAEELAINFKRIKFTEQLNEAREKGDNEVVAIIERNLKKLANSRIRTTQLTVALYSGATAEILNEQKRQLQGFGGFVNNIVNSSLSALSRITKNSTFLNIGKDIKEEFEQSIGFELNFSEESLTKGFQFLNDVAKKNEEIQEREKAVALSLLEEEQKLAEERLNNAGLTNAELEQQNELKQQSQDLSSELSELEKEISGDITATNQEYLKQAQVLKDEILVLQQKRLDFETELQNKAKETAELQSDLTVKANEDIAQIRISTEEKIRDLKAQIAEEDSAERQKELQEKLAIAEKDLELANKFLDTEEGRKILAEEQRQAELTALEKKLEAFEQEKATLEERQKLLDQLAKGEKIDIEEIKNEKNKALALELEAKALALETELEAKRLQLEEIERAKKEEVDTSNNYALLENVRRLQEELFNNDKNESEITKIKNDAVDIREAYALDSADIIIAKNDQLKTELNETLLVIKEVLNSIDTANSEISSFNEESSNTVLPSVPTFHTGSTGVDLNSISRQQQSISPKLKPGELYAKIHQSEAVLTKPQLDKLVARNVQMPLSMNMPRMQQPISNSTTNNQQRSFENVTVNLNNPINDVNSLVDEFENLSLSPQR